MNTRVKELRKELKLSGGKFGKAIGVRRSAICDIEKGRNNLTEQTIKSICREFNVNEQWLRTGEGEMFSEILDDYLSQFNLDELEIKIVKTYLSLTDEQRTTIKDYIKKLNS